MSYNWENTLITGDDDLAEVMNVIDSGALRIALVVDHERKLLGVVTDGDIRRALLNRQSLSTTASSIMNRSPITASATTSRAQLHLMMEQSSIISIPLLDENNVVVGLETIQYAPPLVRSNPVFIMAGGFGTRLKPLTDNCPKPMLEVGGRPMLETLIRLFKRRGFVNFFISTHYLKEKITSYFKDGRWLDVNITFVHEEVPLGTGGALGLLPESALTELPLIMINGDILTDLNFDKLLDFHLKNESVATMCVREYEYQLPYGVVQYEGNKVLGLVEKPISKFFVNAGVYVVSPRVVQSVQRNTRIDMPTVLEKFIEQREKVCMFPIRDYWLDIGRLEDFDRAQADIHSLNLNV